jgi:hypothetical protein
MIKRINYVESTVTMKLKKMSGCEKALGSDLFHIKGKKKTDATTSKLFTKVKDTLLKKVVRFRVADIA